MLQDTVDGSKGDDEKEELKEVQCTPNHRYCSRYGVSTVVCVCESDPVNKVNLEMVRQYCYFATTDVSKMTNSWKRNMLFWWCMTNLVADYRVITVITAVITLLPGIRRGISKTL